MADTLEQMRRQLRMYCPFVPPSLSEYWLKKRWRQVCEYRGWSFLRKETVLSIPAAYSTGTATVTNGSATVTGTGTTWTAAMVGRQFKFSAVSPVFTISAFTDATTITIDSNWVNPTATGTYIILQAYVTMPSDFFTFLTVVDTANQWRLNTNFYDRRHIDWFDPARTTTGVPYILAAYRNDSSEVPRFEMWPHPTALRGYPVLYIKRVADLAASFTLPQVITGDILVEGALADLARWPGPETGKRNPMFNLDLYKTHELEFKARLAEQARQDNEIYQTDLDYVRYQSWPMAPVSAAFAQSHALLEDADAGALF